MIRKLFRLKSFSHFIPQPFSPSESTSSYSINMSTVKTNQTKIVNVLDSQGFDAALMRCVTSLRQEEVIALPTDTIYGVACLAQSTPAVDKVYDIKQRQTQNPVAICVAEVAEVYKWGQVTVPADLLSELLPGPVTLVFSRTDKLNPSLNPNTSLVGIRIPDHRFIRSLCSRCGEPLALTSANVSAAQSTLAVEEFSSLWPRLSVICDGGRVGGTEESRLGSTVVDLSQAGSYRILRDGSAYKSTVQCLARYGLTARADENR